MYISFINARYFCDEDKYCLSRIRCSCCLEYVDFWRISADKDRSACIFEPIWKRTRSWFSTKEARRKNGKKRAANFCRNPLSISIFAGNSSGAISDFPVNIWKSRQSAASHNIIANRVRASFMGARIQISNIWGIDYKRRKLFFLSILFLDLPVSH